LKAIFFNGISFENWRRFQKKIKGISFVKFYPRASLARAAFTLKLSLIPAIDLFFPLERKSVVSVGFQLKIYLRINLCYRKSVVSVGFQLKFSLKITYVIPGKRKSVVSVVFQLKFSLEITYVTSEKRKSVVSVGFHLKFSLEITYVISGKRKSVVSVGFQLKFSLEITWMMIQKGSLNSLKLCTLKIYDI